MNEHYAHPDKCKVWPSFFPYDENVCPIGWVFQRNNYKTNYTFISNLFAETSIKSMCSINITYLNEGAK